MAVFTETDKLTLDNIHKKRMDIVENIYNKVIKEPDSELMLPLLQIMRDVDGQVMKKAMIALKEEDQKTDSDTVTMIGELLRQHSRHRSELPTIDVNEMVRDLPTLEQLGTLPVLGEYEDNTSQITFEEIMGKDAEYD